MIERKFVAEKLKEFQIQEFISQTLKNVGHSHVKLVRTPLGEKIMIHASRPGLVVGHKGENIKKLTSTLKKKFELENPQVEIVEVENPNLDAQIVAERVASTLEKFGIQKFKAIGHKTMQDVMNAGALGVEIIISGKVPSARAKSWRFYSGYLKKCGEVSVEGVRRAQAVAMLKPGTVGVKVAIIPPDIELHEGPKLEKEPAKEVKEAKEAKEVKEAKEKAEKAEKVEKESKKTEKEKGQDK